MDGWIKLYRKLIDWDWFTDSYVVHVFIYLLLVANHNATKVGKLRLKAGQKMTSASRICDDLQLSKPTVLRCLKVLSESGAILVESDNKKSIITIVKYSQYQQNGENSGKTNLPQRLPQDLPQGLPQRLPPIYNKNIKNIKNGKNNIYTDENFENALFENETENNLLLTDTAKPLKRKKVAPKKEKYGEFENVLLSVQEAEKLKSLYGADAPNIVQNFSELKEMKGYKYKSDFMAIKKWGANAYYEQIKKQTNGNKAASIERICEASDNLLEYERQLRAKYAQQSANN